jgi:hypothetical protein
MPTEYNQLSDFKNLIASEISAASNDIVKDRVVDHFKQKEADRLYPLLLQGLQLEIEIETRLSKYNMIKTYDENGEVLQKYWAQDTFDKKLKDEKALEAVVVALGKALGENDYQPLQNAIKQQSNKGSQADGKTPDTSNPERTDK